MYHKENAATIIFNKKGNWFWIMGRVYVGGALLQVIAEMFTGRKKIELL